MNLLNPLFISFALAIGLAIGSFGPAAAQAQQADDAVAGQHFQERFSGSRLTFAPRAGLSNFTLTVAGPDSYRGQVFSARVAPTFRLADHGSVPDGRYTYEITAATTERRQMASLPPAGADGREGPARPGFVGVSQTGRFLVENGRIVPFDAALTEE
jgi:hypothetical protein